MTKAAAKRPTATEPAKANPLEAALFSAGSGASEGGREIDGGGLRTGESAIGEGDGGELTVTGAGADAGVLVLSEGAGTETGGSTAGDGG